MVALCSARAVSVEWFWRSHVFGQEESGDGGRAALHRASGGYRMWDGRRKGVMVVGLH